MKNLEQTIYDSLMINSEQEVMEYIKQHNIYFPAILEPKLLKWNCIPLINLDSDNLQLSFGVFIYQMRKLVQTDFLINHFAKNEDNNKDMRFINPDKYRQLCLQVFKKESFEPFPKNDEFKQLDKYFYNDECFIYEEHFNEGLFPNFESRKYMGRNALNYRILLYKSPNEQGSTAHLIFSTNKDVTKQDVFKFNSSLRMKNQFASKIQTQLCSQIRNNNQNIQDNLQNQQKFQTLPFKCKIEFNLQQQFPNNNQFCSKLFKSTNPTHFRTQQSSSIQNQFNNNCNTINIPKPLYQTNNNQQTDIGITTLQINKQLDNRKNVDDIFATEELNQKQQDQSNIEQLKQSNIRLKQSNIRLKQSTIQLNQSYKQKGESKECDICMKEYELNSDQSIITPCCNQKLHAECLQNDLDGKAIETMNFQKITCFNCRNSLKNYKVFLKKNISNQLFHQIIKREVSANILLQCYKCQLPISSIIKNEQQKIQCINCNTELCSLCCQEYHGENQINQQCPLMRNEIQKILQDIPILVCPFCNLMQTKDDRCNQVNCFGCKRNLCSACSVDAIPIIAHGNHYHREGCPDYKEWKINNEVKTPEFNKRQCQRCQESNQPCEYPISLQEYKKIKQF